MSFIPTSGTRNAVEERSATWHPNFWSGFARRGTVVPTGECVKKTARNCKFLVLFCSALAPLADTARAHPRHTRCAEIAVIRPDSSCAEPVPSLKASFPVASLRLRKGFGRFFRALGRRRPARDRKPRQRSA